MAGDGLSHHLVPMVAQLRKFHIRRPDAIAGDGGHHAAQFSRIAPRFAEVFDGLFTAASVVLQGRPATGEPLEYFGRQFGLVQVELAGDRRVHDTFRSTDALSTAGFPSYLPKLSFSRESDKLPRVGSITEAGSASVATSIRWADS